jgi:hypothetical protein
VSPSSPSQGSSAVAIAVGLCGVAAAYSIFRALQVRLYPNPDPRTLVVIGRIGFFWLVRLALLVGVLVAIAAHALQRRAPGRLEAQLHRILFVTIAIVLLQVVLVP